MDRPPGHTLTVRLTAADDTPLRELGDVDALIGCPADELVLPAQYRIEEITADHASGEHRGTSCVPESMHRAAFDWAAGRQQIIASADRALVALHKENLLLRTVAIDMSQLRVRWSEEDSAFVATTGTYPSLSAIDADPAQAVHRLYGLVTDSEAERPGRLELSEYYIAVEGGCAELRHRPNDPGPEDAFDGHEVDADILGTATDLTHVVDAIYRHHRQHHPLPSSDTGKTT